MRSRGAAGRSHASVPYQLALSRALSRQIGSNCLLNVWPSCGGESYENSDAACSNSNRDSDSISGTPSSSYRRGGDNVGAIDAGGSRSRKQLLPPNAALENLMTAGLIQQLVVVADDSDGGDDNGKRRCSCR